MVLALNSMLVNLLNTVLVRLCKSDIDTLRVLTSVLIPSNVNFILLKSLDKVPNFVSNVATDDDICEIVDINVFTCDFKPIISPLTLENFSYSVYQK